MCLGYPHHQGTLRSWLLPDQLPQALATSFPRNTAATQHNPVAPIPTFKLNHQRQRERLRRKEDWERERETEAENELGI